MQFLYELFMEFIKKLQFWKNIDARIEKHACMVPLSIWTLSPTAPFDKIQISVILLKNVIFSVNFRVNCLKLLRWIAGKQMQYISNWFCHIYDFQFTVHTLEWILMVGVGIFMIDMFFKDIWLILQLPINFYTFNARFVKHTFMIHSSMLIILKAILVSEFIQIIFLWFDTKYQFYALKKMSLIS